MANSPYTGVEHIEPNQAQKEVTANEGFDRLSLFVAETLALTITGDTQLTETQFQEAVRFDLSGTPGAGFLLEVPSTVKKLFIVNNQSDSTVTIQVVGGNGASTSIGSGEQFLFYTDTTDVILLGKGANELDELSDVDTSTSAPTTGDLLRFDGTNFVPFRPPYNVAAFVPETPASDSTVLLHVAASDFNLPASLTGSQGYAETAGTGGVTTFDVQKNGTSVGSVSFADSSNTATFTMASQTSFTAGDRLKIVAPSSLNGIENVSITLKGTQA